MNLMVHKRYQSDIWMDVNENLSELRAENSNAKQKRIEFLILISQNELSLLFKTFIHH